MTGHGRRGVHDLASRISSPVVDFARGHTTVAIERTVARLFGVDGVDDLGVPLPNVLVDALGSRLGEGLALPLAPPAPRPAAPRSRLPRPLRRRGRSAETTGSDTAFSLAAVGSPRRTTGDIARAVEREAMVAEFGDPPTPWKYVIVATGNIYDDADPGAGGGAGRRRRHRRDPLDRAEPARLRPVRRDHRGLRRHLRHAGELPHRARGARRGDPASSVATCG